MSEKEKFDGNGFSRDPIEGDEAARHRHMFHVLTNDFVRIDPETVLNMKHASTLVEAGKILKQVVVVGGSLGSVAFAFAVFAKSQGWL
jgi:hypothetical protein